MNLEHVFENALASFLKDKTDTTLGVAVSGGGDSIALLHLATDWARRNDFTLRVVTVDHHLRPESEQEAAFVRSVAEDLGHQHDTLHWADWTGQGNLQDAARDARKRLIGDWAKENGIARTLLGHTADDRAETFLMRLARGSGVDGLASIQDETNGFLRPLLTVSRSDLRAFLAARNVEWVDDPSNDDLQFDRIKARQMMGHLAELGLTQERILQTADHMKAAKISLQHAVAARAQMSVTTQSGDLLIDRNAFADGWDDTSLRLFASALMWVSGATYRPRFAGLKAASEAALNGNDTTLHGCLIIGSQLDHPIRVTREHNAVAVATAQSNEIWDGRWILSGRHSPDLRIAALGEAIRECPDWRASGLLRASLLASPAIWRGDELVAAPLAGYNPDWTAQIVADFHSSLLTH